MTILKADKGFGVSSRIAIDQHVILLLKQLEKVVGVIHLMLQVMLMDAQRFSLMMVKPHHAAL